MNRNLLIVGAGIYSVITLEIAQSLGCYNKIAFIDDFADQTPNGIPVVGTTKDMEILSSEYTHAIVAIGNPSVRAALLNRIERDTDMTVTTLISPQAYVSPNATISKGCIIEPMAVIQAGCNIGKGCIVCAGAVINHCSTCGEFVQVDCNSIIAGYSSVPDDTKIAFGTFYQNKDARMHTPFNFMNFKYRNR